MADEEEKDGIYYRKPKAVTPTPTVEADEEKQDSVTPTAEETGAESENSEEPTPAEPTATVPQQPLYGNWGDVLEHMERQKAAIDLPTAEDLARERRRKKTDGIIGGISDAARAVANLFFTTQYAPDMYTGTKSMKEESDKRYDKYMDDYWKMADRYYNYAINGAKIKDQVEALRYQRSREELRDRIEQAKAENAAKLADTKYRLLMGELDDKQAQRENRDANAQLDREIKEARRDAYRSQARKNDRWQPSAGRSGRSSGSGSNGSFTFVHNDGRTVTWSKDKVNEVNIANVWYWLPEDVRRPYQGRSNDGRVVLPNRATMLSIIAANLDNEDIWDAIEQTAKPQSRPGNGQRAAEENNTDNAPPSRRGNQSNNNSNTPPSRQ